MELPSLEKISQVKPQSLPAEMLGHSRAGRALEAYRFGNGSFRVSLIAACHADEPTGMLLLTRLVHYLHSLPRDSSLLNNFSWWIVPNMNPDASAINRKWYDEDADSFSFSRYRSLVQRELPGDDVEFGFPRYKDDIDVRPENLAVYRWWLNANAPFHFHASLHGMSVAPGVWYLVEPAWKDRVDFFMQSCVKETKRYSLPLFDIDRKGEKGFFRIAPGFSTRPSSQRMKEYFLERGDEATASLFRPNSMESIRQLGGDPLTLVSEIPLFLGEKTDDAPRPIPIRVQMQLQWHMIQTGIRQARMGLEGVQ